MTGSVRAHRTGNSHPLTCLKYEFSAQRVSKVEGQEWMHDDTAPAVIQGRAGMAGSEDSGMERAWVPECDGTQWWQALGERVLSTGDYRVQACEMRGHLGGVGTEASRAASCYLDVGGGGGPVRPLSGAA